MGIYSENFNYSGKQFTARISQGKVTKISQRSDTEVSGYGQTTIVNGHGGGSTHINSEIKISTEIWVEIEPGKELPFVIRKELSVREGHIVRVLEVLGDDIVGGKKVTTVGNVTVPELTVGVVTFPILKMPKNGFFSGLTAIDIILSIAGLYLLLIPGVVYYLYAKNKWFKKNAGKDVDFINEVANIAKRIANKAEAELPSLQKAA